MTSVRCNRDPWALLEDAELQEIMRRPQQTTSVDTSVEPQAAPAAEAQPPLTEDGFFCAAIQAEYDKVVARQRKKEERAKRFIVEDVRPLSWQWPKSWGEPVSAVNVEVQGIKATNYIFAGGQTCRRCRVKVQGHD
jgi:hypothetical protein